jgi:cyclopropane fatty-acyl-phospholipid synthase-like methyltransferase
MSVASHLGIAVREYDRRIRTFIPNYAEMLQEVANVLDPAAETIVDFGVGTGALSARCLRRAPAARVIGIDADGEMLPLAQRRLGRRATLTEGNFLRTALPRADAVVATLALHHVRTRARKATLYARIRAALRRGGMLLSGDCHPSENQTRWQAQRDLWLRHLEKTYTPAEAEKFLRDWSHEDTYMPLRTELGLLEEAGFRAVDVAWRRGAFAVIAATA